MRTVGLVGKIRELVFGELSRREVPSHSQPHVNLIDTAASGEPVMAGCVQVLGLEALQSRIGLNRKDLVRGVKSIAEGVLDEQLNKADRYRALNDHTFQICFATPDKSRARKQADDIAAAIEKKIAAEPLIADRGLVVDSFVAQVECPTLMEGDNLFSTLHARLLDVRKAARAGPSLRQSLAARSVQIAFQPLWPSGDHEPTLNRPVVDKAIREEIVRELEQSEDVTQAIEALTALDWQIFTRCVEGLHAALQDHRKSDIIIPIQFRTLATPSLEFAHLLRTLPAQYKKFILVEITGVPSKATSTQLLDAVKTAQSVTNRSILNLSPLDHRLNDEITALLWCVSLSVAEPSDERELGCFVLSAAELGLQSMAYGATSISKAEAAVMAGFDYVGGSAVHCTVPIPRPHARFTPLFGDQDLPEAGRRYRASSRSHSRFLPANPSSTVTLSDGQKHICRILNVSISGALILSHAHTELGEYLAIGSVLSRVVRCFTGGFAVQFLELQHLSGLEEALGETVFDLKSLRALHAQGVSASFACESDQNDRIASVGSSIYKSPKMLIEASIRGDVLSPKASVPLLNISRSEF